MLKGAHGQLIEGCVGACVSTCRLGNTLSLCILNIPYAMRMVSAPLSPNLLQQAFEIGSIATFAKFFT
jgi:hypothetical protein